MTTKFGLSESDEQKLCAAYKEGINPPSAAIKRRKIESLLSSDTTAEKLLESIDNAFVHLSSMAKTISQEDLEWNLDKLFEQEKVTPTLRGRLQDIVYRAYSLIGYARCCATTEPPNEKEIKLLINLVYRQLEGIVYRLVELRKEFVKESKT